MIDTQEMLTITYFFVPAYLASMARGLVQRHFVALAVPIDGGRCLRGQRMLGNHKTWRGVVAGVVVGTIVYEMQSFPPGAGWFPIDHLDFPLGAFVAVAPVEIPPLAATLTCAPIIAIGGVVTSAIGYRVGLEGTWI